MTSGGARARSGPAPDPKALRNGRAGADWIRLPATGRAGDPPAFALPRPTRRELAVWADLWTKPQALMWEANGQEREVANFVRTQVEAEKRGAPSSLRNLVLRQEEHLGLSQPGLARNHWIIDSGPEAAARAEPAGDPLPISTARERLERLRKDRDAG